jgi:DNA-binding SARP family transcriptional activator
MELFSSGRTESPSQPDIHITTLGLFDVKKGDTSLVDAAPGSKKLWELFKFMMTHRHRSFTPESLIDSLWSSEDYNDPRSTLRRQMHRLRQILGESDTTDTSCHSIWFINGYYRWNPNKSVQIDNDLFEKSVQTGDALKSDQPVKSLIHYEKALKLYRGDFLPECTEQQWVYSVRNHYRRLYLKTVLAATDVLFDLSRYSDIVRICEQASGLDIYEEEFHLRLIEALLQQGERKQALEHYEHITSFLYQELGLKPSPGFKSLYKRILSTQPTLESMDALYADLDGLEPLENAYYCTPEVFRSIYELERRRSERSGVKTVIGMITLSPLPTVIHGNQQLRLASLQQHLLQQLRKGDTITRWNDSQFLVLLPGLSAETIETVLRRVIQHFANETTEDPAQIQTHCQLILPSQELQIPPS